MLAAPLTSSVGCSRATKAPPPSVPSSLPSSLPTSKASLRIDASATVGTASEAQAARQCEAWVKQWRKVDSHVTSLSVSPYRDGVVYASVDDETTPASIRKASLDGQTSQRLRAIERKDVYSDVWTQGDTAVLAPYVYPVGRASSVTYRIDPLREFTQPQVGRKVLGQAVERFWSNDDNSRLWTMQKDTQFVTSVGSAPNANISLTRVGGTACNGEAACVVTQAVASETSLTYAWLAIRSTPGFVTVQTGIPNEMLRPESLLSGLRQHRGPRSMMRMRYSGSRGSRQGSHT
jgi:hypothetical protein